MEEIWKDVSGAMGYQVSNYGRVRSFWTKCTGYHAKNRPKISDTIQRYLTPKVNKKTGYIHYSFWRGGKEIFRKYIQVLVLETFVGQYPDDGYQACHNDGNKSNNHISNLRWDTPVGNNADKERHGTLVHGEKTSWSIWTNDQIREMRRRFDNGETQADLMRSFGIDRRQIHSIVRRKVWKHI